MRHEKTKDDAYLSFPAVLFAIVDERCLVITDRAHLARLHVALFLPFDRIKTEQRHGGLLIASAASVQSEVEQSVNVLVRKRQFDFRQSGLERLGFLSLARAFGSRSALPSCAFLWGRFVLPLRLPVWPVFLAIGRAAETDNAPDTASIHNDALFFVVTAVLLSSDFTVVTAADKFIGTGVAA